KRPGRLTMEHYSQITNYAVTITGHPEVARTATEWDFWLVGTELDAAVASQRSEGSSRTGFVRDFGTHRLWIITWGELLDDLRRKYENYREALGVLPTATSGLDYVRRVHAQYLPPGAAEQ